MQSSISKLSSGKLDFEKLGQTFVEVNESMANVDFITTCIQRKWGYDYVLVTNDSLRVEYSAGIQVMYASVSDSLYVARIYYVSHGNNTSGAKHIQSLHTNSK